MCLRRYCQDVAVEGDSLSSHSYVFRNLRCSRRSLTPTGSQRPLHVKFISNDYLVPLVRFEQRYTFDLDQRPLRQACHLNGATRRRILREKLGIDRIHPGEVSQILKEDGRLDDRI